jgi:hypothetical protein
MGNYNEPYLCATFLCSGVSAFCSVFLVNAMSDGSSPFDDISMDETATGQPLGDPLAGPDPLAAADPMAADPMAGAIPLGGAVPFEPQDSTPTPAPTEQRQRRKKPSMNVYTAMLGLSLVAMFVACLLLFWELGSYGGSIGTWWKTDR